MATYTVCLLYRAHALCSRSFTGQHIFMNKTSVLPEPHEGHLGRLPGGSIHPLTLGFGDPALEAVFVRRITSQTILLNRLWMVSAIIFLILLGIVEYFVLSEGLTRAWLIRYLLVVPIALTVAFRTWDGVVGPIQRAVRISVIVFVHVTTLFLLAVTPPPANIIYYLLGLMIIYWAL